MIHKYRAWDKIDKLMYCDIHRGIKFDDGSEYSFVDFLDNKGYHEWIIMQDTGLKDDSNEERELYQNDICTANYDCPVSFDSDPHRLLGTIEWDKEIGMWMFDYGHGSMPLSCEDLSNIVYVGTVHENPELLEAPK
ncbi:hypothetical protein LCGC14_2179810 [marine sediment metagenome]|uniref:YopX protein domain-containing protein n=1 Tax=marine sediment metagenome TaxID=412755 RepID=A0A0F9DMM8_9ZZZZ